MNTIQIVEVVKYEGTKYGETDQFPLVGYTITFDDLMTKYYKYGWIH